MLTNIVDDSADGVDYSFHEAVASRKLVFFVSCLICMPKPLILKFLTERLANAQLLKIERLQVTR